MSKKILDSAEQLTLPELTDQQQQFVDHYVAHQNEVAAARAAGYDEEYIELNVQRLKSYPQVKLAIADGLAQLRGLTFSTAADVRLIIARVMNAGLEVNIDRYGNTKYVDLKATLAGADLINKMDGNYAPTNSKVEVSGKNPLTDLMNDIAEKAKEAGPLGDRKTH